MSAEPYDDDLAIFEASGAPALPGTAMQGYVANDGARLWYASYGSGPPVFLLHGGLGNSGNWGYQVPALVAGGYRVVVMDSRGHGRSTRDERPYSYELMGSDVLAVLDELGIERAAFVGWSDGACTALLLAMNAPVRVARVVFFGCNMDPSGTKEIVPSSALGNCFSRHRKDYAALSATPGEFQSFVDAVGLMQRTQPNATAAQLRAIRVPVDIVQAEQDEFIRLEHAQYLAQSIPGATFTLLRGVSHFAPLQRPALFNSAVLELLSPE